MPQVIVQFPIPARMLVRLQSVLQFRRTSLTTYLAELLQANVAEDFSAKLRVDKLGAAPARTPPPSPQHPRTDENVHARKLTAASSAKIRRQFLFGEMSVPAIAQRWGLSQTSIRRVIFDREEDFDE